MIFIYGVFILIPICILLYFYARVKIITSDDRNFISFQRSYLIIYLLAVAGDWLQGPHIYALYDSYGIDKHNIELLFIAGFGSSLLFGTFVASIADKFGRKTNCFIYGLFYGASCITKHFANFWILLSGRIFGGIATSILYSAFESWLVFEHNKRGFNDDLLSTIFSHATLGNSLVAIVSGIVAQYAADSFGFVAPFDIAIIILSIMCVILAFTWPENYGDKRVSIGKHFFNALEAIKRDGKVICLGLIQSLFEGSMYVFVLEWTPALQHASSDVIPHGYIFTSFMLAIMMGSSLFKMLNQKFRPESFMRFVLLLSALCLSVPIIFTESLLLIYIAFIIFEICVGMFWPAMGFMRGIYIPEQTRSTIMTFCRIPLNAIVITILWQNLPMHTIFQFCVSFLILATIIQFCLHRFRFIS
ncbi:unnamed protein product [Dracunculus medinensis]|uniref:Major facilitator superfamily domain-containing protein 5 n=1 Tax=Dracunculus medinensis TaxID=318479 RepID=A0A0N4UL80_DRAME|nr:unnamed protein product [Dracunculus medinensis]